MTALNIVQRTKYNINLTLQLLILFFEEFYLFSEWFDNTLYELNNFFFLHSMILQFSQAFLNNKKVNAISYHISQCFYYLMIKITTIFIIGLLFAIQTHTQHFKKVINTRDPDAKCLDGSPPIYYIHQGNSKSNFIIWFYGGGFFGAQDTPSTIESAYQRSKTLLGSSLQWPQTQNGGGYLSSNPLKNKFAEWTKIMVPYCDGALHQGYAKEPLRYKDATLYFRGALITRSLFQELNVHYGLFNSTKVVLTGASAGGLATFIWSNFLRSKLKNPGYLFSIPDTGVFLNQTTQNGKYLLSDCIVNTYKFANVDEKTPIQNCNAKYPGEQYKCLFFEHAYETIQGPTLFLQSQYDFFSIMFIQNISCPQKGKVYYTLQRCSYDELNQIEAYKLKFLSLMTKFLTSSTKNNLWAIACSGHGYGASDSHYQNSKQKVPEDKGLTVRDAVDKFVFNNERIQSIDVQPWPLNIPCAF